MKTKLMVLFFVLLNTGNVCLQAWSREREPEVGINWFHGTFVEALNESAKQNKLIFLDVYSTWCYPCKYMMEQVFTRPKIYNYINNNFVAYKVNFDDENNEFLAPYKIDVFPTYLFLEKDGAVFHRDELGSSTVSEFFKRLQEVQDRWEKGHSVKAPSETPNKMMISLKTRDNGNDDSVGQTPLHIAAKNGDKKTVQLLLEKGSDINVNNIDVVDGKGRTPLYLAAENGHANVVQLLLDRGANPYLAENEIGRTPLHAASGKNCNIEVVRLLLDRGMDPNLETSKYGITPIMIMVMSESLRIGGQLLLDRGADINRCNVDDSTVLHLAALLSKIDGVRFLLEHGADISKVDNNGKTPIFIAITSPFNIDFNLIQLLLDHGSDINKSGHGGMTPLLATIWSDNASVELVKFVLEHGADTEKTRPNGTTALHLAALGGYTEKARLLLDHGANMNKVDDRGMNSLHMAAQYGYKDVVILLLERGMNPNAVDNIGKTALFYAIDNDFEEIAEILKKYNAKNDHAGVLGNT